jgi:hypothetical protein
MNNGNLKKLVEDSGSLTGELKAAEAIEVEIQQDKEKILNEAQGPGDKRALEKLTVLASRELLAQNQVKLIKRQISGVNPVLINESLRVKQEALAELTARRNAKLAKIYSALSTAYPNEDDRAAAISILNSQRQPAELRQLDKLINGLFHASFVPHQMTAIEFAGTILSLSESANQLAE